ncbi:hypothetical protein THAOC_30867 [Thalassiosira oceanica]|uniref:RWD domain-containing protein n=1 Tax=Thalassiosira oceanica TaxID=159749 RepID=K0RUA9_THAOC|nr:hypothetical protein THAOC_30867 [Thalassiosira oceanica]|eukprot:EJK50192.1 hypothetical protein THAOC_30867 [Thalassiosira oceanica]
MSTEDCERAQEEELEALLAIFPDDIVLRDEDDEDESGPTRPATASYSVRLRGEGIPFVLNVRCPPTYPDLSTPDFEVGYDGDGPARLHAVQEAAVVGVASRAARAGLGTPSVYSSVQSVREFLADHGLAQASVSLLGDDCLALVLRFAAATREDVDAVRRALPVCRAAARSNALRGVRRAPLDEALRGRGARREPDEDQAEGAEPHEVRPQAVVLPPGLQEPAGQHEGPAADRSAAVDIARRGVRRGGGDEVEPGLGVDPEVDPQGQRDPVDGAVGVVRRVLPDQPSPRLGLGAQRERLRDEVDLGRRRHSRLVGLDVDHRYRREVRVGVSDEGSARLQLS